MSYIGEDQVGFLAGRHIKDNLRTVMNILEYGDKQPGKKLGLFFLDVEKAFDNISWTFMKRTLKEMKFGDKFISAIHGIYSDQKTEIWINNSPTDKFNVQKGTRQGCPLSPLLFILVLELLLRKVQADKSIPGIKIKNYHFKYRAFADVFLVDDPKENVPKLIDTIERFGLLAGFYINKTKSKLLMKNIRKKEQDEVANMIQCEVVQKIKYLGIDLINKNIDLFKILDKDI